MSMNRFFTLEGVDGSGKTTVIKEIAKMLENDGVECVLSREPGGTKIADQIRQVVLDANNTEMNKYTEAMLYAASRNQHFFELIEPSLDAGKVVLLDRYIDSTYAYQGITRGIGIDEVNEFNKYVLHRMPHKTFFIDIKPEDALKRVTGADRMDNQGMDFYNKVYESYIEFSKLYPDRYVTINGNDTIDNIAKQIYQVIKENI